MVPHAMLLVFCTHGAGWNRWSTHVFGHWSVASDITKIGWSAQPSNFLLIFLENLQPEIDSQQSLMRLNHHKQVGQRCRKRMKETEKNSVREKWAVFQSLFHSASLDSHYGDNPYWNSWHRCQLCQCRTVPPCGEEISVSFCVHVWQVKKYHWNVSEIWIDHMVNSDHEVFIISQIRFWMVCVTPYKYPRHMRKIHGAVSHLCTSVRWIQVVGWQPWSYPLVLTTRPCQWNSVSVDSK